LAIFTVWITMISGVFANSVNCYRNMSIVLRITMAPYKLPLSSITNNLIFVHH
jgi:hypothetical protein